MTTKTAPAGSRLRAVAAEAGHPIARTLQFLLGDSRRTVVELVAMREHLRHGTTPVDHTEPETGTTQPPAHSR